MDANTLGIYIHELRNQCLFTESAFNIFNQSLQQQSGTGVFIAAHSALAASAHLGQILWPSKARARPRAERLREVLKLEDKHPLNDRRLAEIADDSGEKLDQWIQNTKGEKIVMDLVGPLSALAEQGIKEEAVFRAYDPSTKIFYYRGIGYNMEAIAKGVSIVGSRIVAAHQAMFPEQQTTRPTTAVDNAAAEEAAGPVEPVDTSADDTEAPAND